MSKLSREDVLKLAQLSKLRLNEDEIEKFQNELSEILEYVDKLSSVDVSGIEPTYQLTGLKNVMRPDEAMDYGYNTEDLLKGAPAKHDNLFRVRRVL